MGAFISVVAGAGAFFALAIFAVFAIAEHFWPAWLVPVGLFLVLVSWFAEHETCESVEKKKEL